MQYILTTKTDQGTLHLPLTERPTQVQIRDRGLGEYSLRKPDGSVIKHFRVVTNRRGNPQVIAETPTGLEGISTLNLARMGKAYGTIIKYWPAKAADLKKIAAELDARGDLLKEAQIELSFPSTPAAPAPKAKPAGKKTEAHKAAAVKLS